NENGIITLKNKTNARVDCWSFLIEIYENEKKIEGFTTYSNCYTVLSSKPSAGTRNLNNYVSMCQGDKEKQSKILKFIDQSNKKLSDDDISIVKEFCIKYVVMGQN
ncbi:MAG: hypothetical protein MHPSP_004829, partial [Paramarteilia canceri]